MARARTTVTSKRLSSIRKPSRWRRAGTPGRRMAERLPASNYEFMREQYLDCYGHRLRRDESAVANGAGASRTTNTGAALAFAANEFQLNHWNKLDPRMKASADRPV